MNLAPVTNDVQAGDEAPQPPRYPRQGEFPVSPPQRADGAPIKLAVVTPVCFRYRVPVYRRLARTPNLEVRNFVSTGIPGTKAQNASDLSGLNVTPLWTLQRRFHYSSRDAYLMWTPTLPLHLLRWNPDVILMQGGEPINNLPVFAYARMFSKPIAWWSLGEIQARRHRGLGAVFRALWQYIERRATTYIGYSSVAIDYFRRMGYEPSRCFNLVNVVDTDLVNEKIEQKQALVEPLRDQLRLRGKKVVLYVGSLTPAKGIDNLLQAFAKLDSSAADAHLLIVGDGTERRNAESLARELNLGDRVCFAGDQFENVAAYFQLADLLVVPGTGGLVVSEAMVHGLPVIATVGDGCEVDLIDQGQNGMRIPPGDAGALAKAMQHFLSDGDLLSEAGQLSRQIIDEQHNITTYMNELLAGVYRAYELSRSGSGVAR